MTLPSPPFAATPTPVLSWSWSATNPDIASGSGGAGSGKVTLQDLVLTRNTDSQSPLLFQTLATGAHFDEVVLTTDSVTVTFRLVFVTGYTSDLGDGDKAPVETVTLKYGAVNFNVR
jgi:type VI secretion system secreted protein Hcp